MSLWRSVSFTPLTVTSLNHVPQYAKDEDDPNSLYVRITSYNRGPEPATLHIIPQLWFRNTWSWPAVKPPMPSLVGSVMENDIQYIRIRHPTMERYFMYCLPSPPPVDAEGVFATDEDVVIQPELIFTENDTNFCRLYGGQNASPYVKDAFHDHIIPQHRLVSKSNDPTSAGDTDHDSIPTFTSQQSPFVNPENQGTKSAAHYVFQDVPGNGGCAVVRLRLTTQSASKIPNLEDESAFDGVIEERREEADEFYNSLVFGPMSDDFKQIMRQAFGGMLWTKQFYYFIQKEWIEGDPAQPPPPPGRKHIRNDVCLPNRLSIHIIKLLVRSGVTCTSTIFFPCPTSARTFICSFGNLDNFSQVGVPIFCRLGYRFPLHTSRRR